MIINFVANFQNGYVGEIGDATHLAREMEALGHTVIRAPQDIWKAFVDGDSSNSDWTLPTQLADINIICKWHHFSGGQYIEALRDLTNAPVFYWVWDYMDNQGIPQWHKDMVSAADLYLGNDVRNPYYALHNNSYYFPFDVADGELPVYRTENKKYDVAFFGSCIGQGNRIEWLTEINKTNPIKIFAWNHEEWQKRGFDASPAVYEEAFVKAVGESKIVLGFSVEPNSWGYWSNRVGKVLLAGGFLLYQYAPGMELFLSDGVEYFSSVEEAREKIDHYLIADTERSDIARRGFNMAQERMTSKARVKDLMILAERFLKTKGEGWKI